MTDRTTRADSALNTAWRNDDDGSAVLKVTPDGLAAISIEPMATTGESEAAPAGDAVDYRFNDGTNSAGEPAASTQAEAALASAEAPKKRGRPKKTTEPAEAPRKRSRPKKAAAEPIAPLPTARPATTPSRRS